MQYNLGEGLLQYYLGCEFDQNLGSAREDALCADGFLQARFHQQLTKFLDNAPDPEVVFELIHLFLPFNFYFVFVFFPLFKNFFFPLVGRTVKTTWRAAAEAASGIPRSPGRTRGNQPGPRATSRAQEPAIKHRRPSTSHETGSPLWEAIAQI